MEEQMYELLEMVEGVETTMENICTLATSIHVTKDIIVNLNVTKLSLVECKNSLITFSNKEFNLEYLEKKNNENSKNKQDIKPIKIENVGLEVKPEILNSKNLPENDNDDEIQLSPKRFEEMIGFDTEDLDNINYEDGAAFEITEGGTICKVCDSPTEHISISCNSCRIFFKRGQPNSSCIYNNDECKITKETRVHCKSCRYNKCIEVGMVQKREDPENEHDESSNEMGDEGMGLLREKCRVCGSPASENKNYGAICCFSCKAFFRRGQPVVRCVANTDECRITKKTRVKCKSCRYNKCIQIGMIPEKVKNHKALTEKRTKIVKNEEQLLEDVKPTEKVKKKKKRVEELNQECKVCGSPAPTHLNYGAIACFSCRAFFRRGRPKNRCINNSNKCKITKTTKAGCPCCRYNKCLVIGMVPALVNTKNPEKNLTDDISIVNDVPMEVDNGVANDNSDTENFEENDNKEINLEKPEEPSFHGKAEIFVEFMKTVKKNDDYVVYEVVVALETKNYEFFTTVKEKDGEIMKQCVICKCSKKFLRDPNHIKNHFNFNPCKICGLWLLQFQSPRHKEQKHWKRCRDCSHPVKNFENHTCPRRVIPSGLKCEMCGESFNNPAKLSLHKLMKHSNKNFICDICGRTDFEHIMAYRRHMKTHSEQVYTCKICQQQFKSISELSNHKKDEHLDVIGQFCDICGIVVPSLKTHNRFKHAPANCDICGKQFAHKDSLSRHIQTTHDKRHTVQCDVCNKEFSCRSTLTKHLKRVHKMNIAQKENPLKMEKF